MRRTTFHALAIQSISERVRTTLFELHHNSIQCNASNEILARYWTWANRMCWVKGTVQNHHKWNEIDISIVELCSLFVWLHPAQYKCRSVYVYIQLSINIKCVIILSHFRSSMWPAPLAAFFICVQYTVSAVKCNKQ